MKDELTKQLADSVVADLERTISDTVAGPGGGQRAGLDGLGLSLLDVVKAWQRVRQACPWLRWVGKAELRPDAGNWMPADWPAMVIQLPDGGAAVYVKPAALDEIRKAWGPGEPTDGELAAMIAWLAEVQAAREGKTGPTPDAGRGGILDLDQV